MIEGAQDASFPAIVGPQRAGHLLCNGESGRLRLKNVAHGADLVLVVGSKNSSNSNRLVEVSKNLDTNSFLIDSASGYPAGVAGWREYGGSHGRGFGAGGSGQGRCRISAVGGLRRCG